MPHNIQLHPTKNKQEKCYHLLSPAITLKVLIISAV